MKKGLLIHSYEGGNWLDVVWGHPPNRPGRLVTGVEVILEENIDLALICGSSAGKKEKKACFLMRNKLYAGMDQLKAFTDCPALQKYSLQYIKERINAALRVESAEGGTNTLSELNYAMRVFHEAGIKKIFLVSSPDHIVRCMRDALAIAHKEFPHFAANIFAAASFTLYSSGLSKDIADMNNVIVVEPPMKNKLDISRVLGVLDSPEAVLELDALLKRYGR